MSPSASSPSVRFWVVLVLIGLAVVAAGVAAVAYGSSGTKPEAPIGWRGEQVGSSITGTSNIRLEEDGSAFVVNLPRGRESEEIHNERTYSCFEPTVADPYTGVASWERVSDWRFRLRFETTSIVLFAEKSGYFLPDPDWRNTYFSECGDDYVQWYFTRVNEPSSGVR